MEEGNKNDEEEKEELLYFGMLLSGQRQGLKVILESRP